MSFCIDCQYYFKNDGSRKSFPSSADLCIRPLPKKTVSLVTGLPILATDQDAIALAGDERSSSGADNCGPKAQFFLKK